MSQSLDKLISEANTKFDKKFTCIGVGCSGIGCEYADGINLKEVEAFLEQQMRRSFREGQDSIMNSGKGLGDPRSHKDK